MRRRDFITLFGGAAASWPLAAHAQQPAMPVVGILGAAPALIGEKRMLPFHRGLSESGYSGGQNVALSYLRAEGQYDRLPQLAAELVRRQVSVIVAPNSVAGALAAKNATTTIPIVFSVTADPVRVGLVVNIARPDGNVTGAYSFTSELGAKRLGLLHELVPSAASVAVLANRANPITELGLQNVQAAARAIGLRVHILKASTAGEIDTAFAEVARERPDAFMTINDPLFSSRRTQIVLLAARHAVPAIYNTHEFVEAGGLMSYSPDLSEIYHQLGTYTGRILKGARPTDLPVVQSTKFELVINAQTARMLGLTVPDKLLALADQVIE